MNKQYSLNLLLLLLPLICLASNIDAAYIKTKNIKKAYYVNTDAGINIDNSYGNITVTTWDEDKIELDITIKVSGNNEGWVNQRINEIDIDINALKQLITAKTILGNISYKTKGNNNSFEINYVIKIPKKGSVTLRNKYGNITLADLWASTEINCKYGNLTTGKLYGTKNTIQIEYCPSSSIEYLNSGTLIARYSGLRINALTKIDLISDYTETRILEGDLVQYSSKYGALKVEKVKSIVGTANYMELQFGEVNGQFNLTAKYCQISIDNLSAKANDCLINGGYSNMKIGYSSNYDFDFDINLRYANLKYDNDFVFSSREETSFNKAYRGYFSKKGVNNLTIKSDYGNISLLKK
jgi:hypothetical protein